ncbi:MAG: hypothetical protein LBV16_07690 [Elusimicrobiota bacterium]|nr:hypothetical protein [Elusimicrobiota bacterium]
MSPTNLTSKQIVKTISEHASVCVSVGADPRVCPPPINMPSTHKSPTPSFPNVFIGNPFLSQSASFFNNLCRLFSFLYSRFSLLFGNPFFNKIKAKALIEI